MIFSFDNIWNFPREDGPASLHDKRNDAGPQGEIREITNWRTGPALPGPVARLRVAVAVAVPAEPVVAERVPPVPELRLVAAVAVVAEPMPAGLSR